MRTWSGTSYRVFFPYKKHVNTLSTLRVVKCAYFWMYTITGKKEKKSVQSRVFQQCKFSGISLCASGAASAIREYLCVRVCNHRRGLTIIYIYIFLNILCISSYTVRYRETFLYIYKRHTHTRTHTQLRSSRVECLTTVTNLGLREEDGDFDWGIYYNDAGLLRMRLDNC